MSSHEIAPADWTGFVDGYSRQHRGWLVSLYVVDASVPDCAEGAALRSIARDLRLAGISCTDGTREIAIALGDGAVHLDHRVARVRRLLEERAAEGAHAGLRLETEDGEALCLRFRVPARPEALDGLAPGER